MKTFITLFQLVKKRILSIFSSGKAILVLLALSLSALLSSCAIGYRTPDYEYYDETPDYGPYYYGPEYYGGVIIDPWNYHWRHEHHEWIHSHPNWRHDYRDYRGGFHRGEGFHEGRELRGGGIHQGGRINRGGDHDEGRRR